MNVQQGQVAYLDFPDKIKIQELRSFVANENIVEKSGSQIKGINLGKTTITFTKNEPVYVFSINVYPNSESLNIVPEKTAEEIAIESQIKENVDGINKMMDDFLIAAKLQNKKDAMTSFMNKKEFEMLSLRDKVFIFGTTDYEKYLEKSEIVFTEFSKNFVNSSVFNLETKGLSKYIKDNINTINNSNKEYIMIDNIFLTGISGRDLRANYFGAIIRINNKWKILKINN
jgi:hypothetical protein